jgi:hypothetical protein
MNKKFIITSALLFFILANKSYAAAPTPTTSAAINNQINQLKDKIASQVSKLNLVEKRGMVGTVQAVTNNQITLSDLKGNTRYVDVDEITKFSSGASGSSSGISDVKKGNLISVLGIYNKESQRILARYVNTEIVPVRYAGEITAIDGKNFQITIMTIDQKSVKIEIDTTSTVSSYSNGASLTKYGFSKLNVGDRVYVVGYSDKKDATLLIADRMIVFVNAPKNQNIMIVTPTAAPTIAPTSAGAKSIKPIK